MLLSLIITVSFVLPIWDNKAQRQILCPVPICYTLHRQLEPVHLLLLQLVQVKL